MSICVFNRGRSGLALETATGEVERDSLKAFPISKFTVKLYIFIQQSIFAWMKLRIDGEVF